MDASRMINDFPKGLLNWYDFDKGSSILYLGKGEFDSLKELLRRQCVIWDEIILSKWKEQMNALIEKQIYFDYIVLISVLEEENEIVELLRKCKALLSGNGHLLIGANNRLGLRYFCGDRDPYSNRSFDGIENYRRLSVKDKETIGGRCFSRNELKELLKEVGLNNNHFYAVLPDLKSPQLIYEEGFLPNEELGIRYTPHYNYPDGVFLEEEYLYTDLINNGMFHQMANSYLIECSLTDNKDFSSVKQVTLSMDRGPENAIVTIIRDKDSKKTVEKRAIYPEALRKAEILKENSEELRRYGVKIVDFEVTDNVLTMPYIDAPTAIDYLKKLAQTDKEEFVKQMDRFRDIILNSSDCISEDDNYGKILKHGYIDLVPLNCFYLEGEYVFFDQEFFYENMPANVIVSRLVGLVYMNYTDSNMESIIPAKFFLERYNILKEKQFFENKINDFLIQLRNKRELKIYAGENERDAQIVHSNRQKINYSQKDYQRLFIDIFSHTEDKHIVLFGSGTFAKRFFAQFGHDYKIDAIVDNNENCWGKELEGIKICSPDIFDSANKDEYHVIICVKNYIGIVKQLENIGIKNYSIFDYNIDFPRRKNIISNDSAYSMNNFENMQTASKKKYHLGYIAGVFDLFHIGHLNLLKRAKELCDYLIVGVVTDEGVRINKKTEPFVSFEERIEIVRSCKYVDEAVEIPHLFCGTRDAYKMYHFDVQFSGSDYINDPSWLADKKYLEKNGAEMVFFPYTQTTSSSKLKAALNKEIEKSKENT